MAESAPRAAATLRILEGGDRPPAFDPGQRIGGFDDELAAAMRGEAERQELHLELIASENYASPRVLEAQGSVLTNKYAEGYSGRRYYGGCEFVDVAESLAVERAMRLFGADYANVQPHSGSQANAAAYLALAKPGDTILGMSLAEGGHLTHGSPVNFSGQIFRSVQYGLDPRVGRDRLRPGRGPRPRAPAADRGGRLLRLLARHRLGAVPGHRGRGRRVSGGRCGPRRGPHRGRALPEPGAVRRCDHDHHPQDLAGPAGRPHRRPRQPRDREAPRLHRLPRNAGRAAHARHRGQGGSLQGGRGAGLHRVSAGDGGQRPPHGDHH